MQMSATLLDLGIVLVVVVSTAIGLSRGFIRESFSLLSWVVALAFTVLYFQQVAAALPFQGLTNVARIGIAAAIIFFCVLVIGAIISYILKTGLAAVGLSIVDHFLGAVLGLARGALIVILVVLLAGAVSLPDKKWWQESRLVPKFRPAAEWVKVTAIDKLSPLMERVAEAGVNNSQP